MCRYVCIVCTICIWIMQIHIEQIEYDFWTIEIVCCWCMHCKHIHPSIYIYKHPRNIVLSISGFSINVQTPFKHFLGRFSLEIIRFMNKMCVEYCETAYMRVVFTHYKYIYIYIRMKSEENDKLYVEKRNKLNTKVISKCWKEFANKFLEMIPLIARAFAPNECMFSIWSDHTPKT